MVCCGDATTRWLVIGSYSAYDMLRFNGAGTPVLISTDMEDIVVELGGFVLGFGTVTMVVGAVIFKR